jgi:asparagine synthase (glutamine-hydrolysing)
LLQLGSYVTKKKFIFEPGPWDEDIYWLYGETSFGQGRGQKGGGDLAFPYGGTYLLKGSNSKAIIRCTDPHSRPSHADQLHVDLWVRGQNIACDAGTYLYSGDGPWRNGLAHTTVHNTVTVDGLDQMNMLTRFTWTDWSHGKVLRHAEKTWQGEHDGYMRLDDPVNHRRTVISLREDRWLVVDHLTASQPHHYDLHWLLTDADYGVQELPGTALQGAPGFGLRLKYPESKLTDSLSLQMGVLEGNANFSVVRADPTSTRGWRSRYYGEKEPAISVLLQTDQTSACFWSYFGLPGDNLHIVNGSMHISSGNWNTTIDLNPLNK